MSHKPMRRSPTGERLDDVELFASGDYRGIPYTVDDCREIVKNFVLLGPTGKRLLDPPAVIGHEEKQRYLELTDQPAAGWVMPGSLRLKEYVDPKHGPQAVIIGNIDGVPTPIANRIRSGQYRKVSAEIYPDFQDDHGNSYGKALRRVAILGAEVPQVKRISDLPMPKAVAHSECGIRPLETMELNGFVVCFSEVVMVDKFSNKLNTTNNTTALTREEMKTVILQELPTLTMPFLNSCSDDMLAELLKSLTQDQAASPTDGTPVSPQQPATMPGLGQPPLTSSPVRFTDNGAQTMSRILDRRRVSFFADPAAGAVTAPAVSRDEMIAEITAMDPSKSATELQAMDDAGLKALYDQMAGGGSAAPAAATPAAAPMADGSMSRDEMIAELQGMGEDPATLAMKSDDELMALLTELQGGGQPAADMGDMSGMNMQAMNYNEQIRVATEITRRNNQIQLRQIRDAQLRDATTFCENLVREGRLYPSQRPFIMGQLLRADHIRVETFAEGRQAVRRTQFEQLKAQLAKWPVIVRMSERIPGGGDAPQAASDATAEAGIIRRFAEAHAGVLKKTSKTVEKFCEEFAEIAKKKPGVKAADYIGADMAKQYAG
jgi:hypothetical protein